MDLIFLPLLYIIITLFIRSTVLLTLIGLAFFALRRKSAAVRHIVLVVGLAGLVLLPLTRLSGTFLTIRYELGVDIINETAARLLGFKNPADVLGKFIRLSGTSRLRLPIAGVIRDFNSTTLKEKMSPLVVVPAAKNFYTLAAQKTKEVGLSALVAWATVGYRAVRAATADPVKALKYE